ncbi:polar amino acid transport system substrate-binding protein [Desulfocicer vacuolatum DSM 3385]|uniref:Sensory/regulatory protein RpfC n=1 Tax=Desulfocicer vacuolatum DSM 3385 TaxID=1121400 RepID=A0A1W2AZ30_9BACT|nr:response regulator [Desulfocicer vacuolatum]SMC65936.1 polar amino acid transport system substrate-binding protein [Desulfocicer vacuolatum DSM 3385]
MEQHLHDGTAVPGEYHGKILKGNHSRALKTYISDTILRIQGFEQTPIPVIPYLSAWQEQENTMWYEFAGQDFCTLMQCSPDAMAETFRNSIVERRVYNYRETDKGQINTQTIDSSELPHWRKGLREEGKKTGKTEAVYKVKLPDGSIVWLKDQATVKSFDTDRIHISSGCLTPVTKEMEAEEELIRTRNKLEKNARALKLAKEIQDKNSKELSLAIEAVETARKEAEKANRAKSEFLAVISHEIRNPMNGILGTCDLIMTDELSPRQSEYLGIIKSAAISLLGLINDILDFSKIEAGKLAFMETPFTIREVIEDVSDLFLELVSKKRLELVLDIHPDVPDTVISDPMRLRQVLINLTSNALKFTEKGEIIIGVTPRQNNGSHADLEFHVTDTGIGIAPEHQENLFDSFTQVNDPEKQESGGTGLGLAISRQIVTMMNGSIWVESTPGKGSAFYFKAPFKCPSPSREPSLTVPKAFARYNALVVAGNSSSQQVLKRLLHAWGFKVSVAMSGDEALAMLTPKESGPPFELILMDMALDALEPAHGLAKLTQFSPRSLFIALINTGREKELRRAMDLGIKSSLTKPLKQALLLETVKQGLGFPTKALDAGTTTAPPGERFLNTRVLIVEDNIINLKIGAEMLRLAGVEVDTAQNGMEAVEKVQSTTYDALLIDIQMPLLDGIEASQVIRQKFSSHDLPIIAMSAHAKSIKWKACLAAGINDYILKPFNKKDLLAVLKKQLGYRHGIAPVIPPETTREKTDIPAMETLSPLNLREGIDRLGGDPRIFADILWDFCEEHAAFYITMKNYLKNNDFQGAATLAHSIKGASGNISAPRLFGAARDLEQACWDKKEDKIKQLLPRAKEAFLQVYDAARQFMTQISQDDDTTRGPSREQARTSNAPHTVLPQMEALLESLESFDPIASETLFKEIEPLVPAVEKEKMNLLAKHIQNYQFDDARTVLESLMGTLTYP